MFHCDERCVRSVLGRRYRAVSAGLAQVGMRFFPAGMLLLAGMQILPIAGESTGLGMLIRAACAEEPSEEVLEIRKLVRQLDDDQLSVRNAAEAELVSLGPSILDHLPKASDRMSAEAKHRLARLRNKLEKALADMAMQSTKVTFQGKAVPLAELLAAIEEQTGNKVSLGDLSEEPMSMAKIDADFSETDFWPAIDQVLDQAGLTTYHFSRDRLLALTRAADGQLPRFGRASYAGPFRFEAIRIDAHRQLRTPTNQALRVQLEIAWEPRLLPIGLTQRLQDVEALDPDGNTLEVTDEQIVLSPTVHAGTTAVEMQIPFALPSRNVERIARLHGKLIALVPGRVEVFRFENLDKGNKLQKRKGSVTVALDSVRKNNELWEVRMRVHYPQASGALESHRGWVFRNECYLLDPDQQQIEHVALETTRQTETEVGLAFLFDAPKNLAGSSFVYHTPASILRMPVEFELQDIDLP